MSDLQFRLDIRSPALRRIVVRLEVDRSAIAAEGAAAVEFFLPTWTPGSYLIREFARHLGPVRAADADSGRRVECTKSHKNRYRVELPAELCRLRLDYWVYAHELSVRTADVTAEHAYWNHACVLLWPVDRGQLGATIVVDTPESWDCIGALPVRRRAAGQFEYRADDFDAVVDAPVLAGTFVRLDLEVRGVQHELALDGLGAVPAHPRLVEDVRRIVAEAAAVFGGELPYRRYTFLCLFADTGFGGLEHADSTTLLCARTSMSGGKSYQEFLGLLAHELFHAWNVKRMRPAELWSYDYEVENLTRMLWLAEGFTAYYDDLLCRRAELLTVEEYLALVAKNLTAAWSSMGRFRQSLAEASYDAWIRHYRPDENTRNSTQNYYGNGALAAMVLDLTIRRATRGERCLDDAVAALYRETHGAGRGYELADIERCLSNAAGQDLKPLLHSLTASALDPDFAGILADFGIRIESVDADRPYLGFQLESGRTVVASVTDDGPADRSGLCPGDEVLALNGLRTASDRWSDLVQSVAVVGQPLRILTASRGIIAERTVVPAAAPRTDVRLALLDVTGERAARRRDWLRLEAPTPATAQQSPA